MKRPISDDSKKAKRLKVLEGFGKLEIEAKDAHENNEFLKVISICNIIHRIDPTHLLGHYWIGRAYYSVRDLENSLLHLEKYLDIGDDDGHRLVIAYSCQGFALAKTGRYAEAISIYTKAMKYSDFADYESYLKLTSNLAILYGKIKDHEMKTLYYQMHIDKSIDVISTYDCKEFFTDYKSAYKHCHPEKAAEMKKIMKDENSFRFLMEDAYEKWNDLSPIHQKHIQISRPKDYKQLESFSRFTKFSMLHMGLIFTDETIGIIHECLYKF